MKKILLLLFMLAAYSCDNKKNEDISEMITDKLMEDIEKDSYSPPVDGKLTEAQVHLFLHVKKEELTYIFQNLKHNLAGLEENEKKKKIAGLKEYMTTLRTIGNSTNAVATDLQAAKKLGYNAREYEWVRNVIINTNLFTWADTTSQIATERYEKTLQELIAQQEAAATPEEKNLYDQQINAIRLALEDMESKNHPLDETTVFNKMLLEKFEDEIAALEAEIKRCNFNNGKEAEGN